METNISKIDHEIYEIVENVQAPEQLKEAMHYSLKAGGKRIRPLFVLAVSALFNNIKKESYTVGAVIEMIHTYSLIHDDLPAMDDDDYRRGLLTNHKVFGEATAILAGDALLTFSFEMITNDALLSNSEKVYLIQLLAQASGPTGMVAGQILDMEAENQTVTIEMLEKIHALKTGELLRFAVTAGAYLGNATKEQISYLQDFAHYLGLIFQVQDDILDVTGDEQKLGKAVGSDESNNKSTYPKLLGLEKAISTKLDYMEKAKQSLQQANITSGILYEIIDYLGNRDH